MTSGDEPLPSHEPHAAHREPTRPASPHDATVSALDSKETEVPAQAPVATPSRFPSVRGFEIEEELGRGGMGVVYRARSLGLQRQVALKVLLAGRFATPQALERFQIEARAAARLNHPNIVGVHEVGESDGGSYLVMELLEGESLEARLQRKGALTQRQAARICQQIAQALHYAHERSVIHRDVKPGNILLTEGRVDAVLMDFGLAKEVGSQGLTLSGQVLGTPAYMSPEQASGRAASPASDVYSLGVTLYELLTGRLPFEGGTTVSLLARVLSSQPVRPSKHRKILDPDIEVICLKCLEKEPEARYASALELAEDLGRYLEQKSIVARAPTTLELGRRWVRRNSALAALVLGVGGLGVLGAGTASAWAAYRASRLSAARAAGEAEAATRRHAEEERARATRARAEANEPWGMYEYGKVLLEGRGAPRDRREAARWFRLAADAGNLYAMDQLGYMLQEGHDVDRKDAEAIQWFRRAAEGGVPSAMGNYAAMLHTGRGAAKDDVAAARWFLQGAQAGDLYSMIWFAYMLESGDGVAKDEAGAVSWYRRAREAGSDEAETKLERLLGRRPDLR